MISLLVPTRHRPAGLLRTYDTAMATASDPGNVEVIAAIDSDDPSYFGISAARLRFVYAERPVLTAKWNIAWRQSDADFFMLASDDIAFRTQGWDRMVLDAFPPDGIAAVFGDDGANWRPPFGTHPFLSRAWTDATDEFGPGYYAAGYIDKHIAEVAIALDRYVYVKGLFIEHLHPHIGRGEMDPIYEEGIANLQGQDENWRKHAPHRAADIEALERALGKLAPVNPAG